MQRMHGDHPKAQTKRKELVVDQALRDAGVEFDYQVHVPFRTCGLGSETSCAYLDFAIEREWGCLIVECDESQHAHYTATCDVRRDFDVAASIALGDSAQKLAMLHYNPDCFRVAGASRTVTTKKRLARLVEAIRELPEPKGEFSRYFLYYDKDEDHATLPTIAKEWNVAARDGSWNLAE